MRIAVIKLGAKGDVVRTIPIVKALKDENPGAEIHWFTKKSNRGLLEHLDFVDFVSNYDDVVNLDFDLVINFDMEDEATGLSEKISAEKKLGFYKDGEFVLSRNLGGEYYLNTLFDDELKKSNKRTYQSMMFELAELDEKDGFDLPLKEEHLDFGNNFLKENDLEGKRIIGIHMGAGPRWPSKAWHEDEVKDFVKSAKEKGYEIILFGGPDEIERYDRFNEELESEGLTIYRNNPMNTDSEFASLVQVCHGMVCSDSFALHVALGLRKPTVGMFFVTSPHEVEEYGLLKKAIAPRLGEFFPEKMDQYDGDLVKSLKAQEILDMIEEEIKKSSR